MTRNTLTTRCGRVYGVRLQSWQHAPRCPTCGRELDAEELRHDGYSGSAHAHDGAGSMGLAAHHHCLVCEVCSQCDCEVCAHEHGDGCDDMAEQYDTPCVCGRTLAQVREAQYVAETDGEEVRCPVTGEALGWRHWYDCPCGRSDSGFVEFERTA
jgi:hypothetical protein